MNWLLQKKIQFEQEQAEQEALVKKIENATAKALTEQANKLTIFVHKSLYDLDGKLAKNGKTIKIQHNHGNNYCCVWMGDDLLVKITFGTIEGVYPRCYTEVNYTQDEKLSALDEDVLAKYLLQFIDPGDY